MDRSDATTLRRLVERVLARGQVDTFICAYRACPDILTLAGASRRWRGSIEEILAETKDAALLKRLALQPLPPVKMTHCHLGSEK